MATDDNYKHPADEKKVKFKRNTLGTRKDNIIWIVSITIISFIFSASLLFISSNILNDASTLIALIVVLIIIFTGIIFDIIGIAVTAADETPFHAMASRKYYGAKQSIKLIRNANKVSSFCNDVIGDICGVISGTASALIVVNISLASDVQDKALISLIISGTVAALTVGGKAVGKTFAIANSNYIVYKVSVIIQFITGRIKINANKKKARRN